MSENNNWFLSTYGTFTLYNVFSNYFNLSFFQIIALIGQIKNVSSIEIHCLSNNKYRWFDKIIFNIVIWKFRPGLFEEWSKLSQEITNELEANELLIILISFPISFFLSFLLIFVEYIFEASQNFYRNSSIHFFNEKNIYTIFKKYKI